MEIKHVSNKDNEQLKHLQLMQLEEIKYLREDMLQTRADLQKTFIYTFALATIIATLSTQLESLKIDSHTHYLLLISSILFQMLALNYIGNMRAYLNLGRYLELKCKDISDSFDFYDGPILPMDILRWEYYNRDFYKKGLSKIVFSLTWGVQPFYPTFFGIITFSLAIFEFSIIDLINDPVLILLTALPVLLMLATILSMIKALIEISSDISLAKQKNRYKQRSTPNL